MRIREQAHTHTHTQRERERERERLYPPSLSVCGRVHIPAYTHACTYYVNRSMRYYIAFYSHETRDTSLLIMTKTRERASNINS